MRFVLYQWFLRYSTRVSCNSSQSISNETTVNVEETTNINPHDTSRDIINIALTPSPLDTNDYISEMPHDILSRIIASTSPSDLCRLATVSHRFNVVADSNDVWGGFLPANLPAGLPNDFLALKTRKERYLYLCDRPVPLRDNIMSFRLDSLRGAGVYMLPARTLKIAHRDNPEYWRLVAHPDSWFEEVARLRSVCWFDIWAEIDRHDLPAQENYVAYLIFQTTNKSGGLDEPYEATVSINGCDVSNRLVCLEPNERRTYQNVVFPQARGPWLEIELGEFHNDDEGHGEVRIRLSEIVRMFWKSGLIVEGIEIRQKEN